MPKNFEQKEEPALTNATVPRPAVPPPPTAPKLEIEDANIIAKPLVTPDFTEVTSKNPNLSFRYANRVAGDPPGMQVELWQSVGFRPATEADCSVRGLVTRNGQFIKGDLILLCIARSEYEGALKWNRQKALNRMDRTNVRKQGRQEIGNAIKEAGVRTPPNLSQKLQVFTPDAAQVAGLVGEVGEQGQ